MVKVALRSWSEDDLPLLQATNAPEMTLHLGGPETAAKVEARHRRYLAYATAAARMLVIVDDDSGEALGSIGYWARSWLGEHIYETGWGVLPQYQWQGVASRAIALALAAAAAERTHPFVHAFPSVQNAASNALCRKAGFSLKGECDFEYPPGSWMRCNDWAVDCRQLPAGPKVTSWS